MDGHFGMTSGLLWNTFTYSFMNCSEQDLVYDSQIIYESLLKNLTLCRVLLLVVLASQEGME